MFDIFCELLLGSRRVAGHHPETASRILCCGPRNVQLARYLSRSESLFTKPQDFLVAFPVLAGALAWVLGSLLVAQPLDILARAGVRKPSVCHLPPSVLRRMR